MKIKDKQIDEGRIEFTQIPKERFHKEIQYKTTILNHGTYISIHKQMFMDGIFHEGQLTHIPNDLLPAILKMVEQTE